MSVVGEEGRETALRIVRAAMADYEDLRSQIGNRKAAPAAGLASGTEA